jgi:hypothetical protein
MPKQPTFCWIITLLLVACAPLEMPTAPTLLTATPLADSDYPIPLPQPPTMVTGYDVAASIATLTTTEIEQSQRTQRAALATASAPRPTATLLPPTHTPLPDGTTCFVNHTAGFTLTLLPGWHTDDLWEKSSTTLVYNYDPEQYGSEGGLLPDKLKININIIPLTGKTFEEWIVDERAREDSGDPPNLELTEPYLYTLGKYQGVAYKVTGYGDDALLIKLRDTDKVISIGLWPEKSSALEEALRMLSTLDASGEYFCE